MHGPEIVGDRVATGVDCELRQILRRSLQCTQRNVGQNSAVFDPSPSRWPDMELQTENLAERAQPFHRGDMAAPHIPNHLGRALRP